jgi:hypothetical protein
MMNREIEIKKITEYFDELLWEFEKLSKTELTFEQKTERIAEKLNLPSDFIINWFNRNVGQVIA